MKEQRLHIARARAARTRTLCWLSTIQDYTMQTGLESSDLEIGRHNNMTAEEEYETGRPSRGMEMKS